MFGYSAAISGDTAIVSAINDDTITGTDAGSAFIFVRNADVWTQQAQLFPSIPGTFDQFGYSVAIDGDTAVVGADWDNTNAGTNAGSAWVYVRQNGIWTQQQRLLASDAAANDIFGVSVAISGNTIFVGAAGDNTPVGNDAGSVYVFVRNGTVWTEQSHLFASDAAAGDFFGFSLKMDGDTAVVSAVYDDTANGTNAGSAYVFKRVNGIWNEQGRLFASDGQANDEFGYGLDISGDTIIVGSTGIYPPDGVSNAGSAYLFERNAEDIWTPLPPLVSPSPAPMEHFGWSVAVDGNTALIGAPFNPELGGGPNIGSAYTFIRGIDGVWTHDMQIESSDGAAGDIFGFYVALEGNTGVVTADFDDTAASVDAGSVYFFDLACNPRGDLNCDNAVNFADVPHFIEALLATGNFSGCDITRADVNPDGLIDGRDVPHFVNLLVN